MKSFALIIAAAIGGIAVTAALIQMQQPDKPQTEIVNIPLDEGDHDPVRSELRRCQALGAAGADDKRCLNAWAEMRSRFFRSSVSANPALRENGEPLVVEAAEDALSPPEESEMLIADTGN